MTMSLTRRFIRSLLFIAFLIRLKVSAENNESENSFRSPDKVFALPLYFKKKLTLKLRTPEPTQSKKPSSTPSRIPSFFPSSVPSLFPSVEPTVSSKPTDHPSTNPSESPSISHYPSMYPSAIPSQFPTSSPTKVCRDNPNYRSKFELPCRTHRNLSCDKMYLYGYNANEVGDLLDSCKESCGICDTSQPSAFPSSSPSRTPSLSPSVLPSMIPSLRPSNVPIRNPTLNPSLNPTYFEPTFLPTLKPSNVPTLSCHDVSKWSNRLLLTCLDFRDFDCSVVSKLGFSQSEVDDVYANCPKSCGVCGTIAPISTPSHYPSVTASLGPSGVPSAWPSHNPTHVRTPNPTTCFDTTTVFCEHWVFSDLNRCNMKWKDQVVNSYCRKTCKLC
uniref:ShKT domain-containing protein n=1 Tax=Corethron hystrix TaxID=216773 RepID=A0A7S1FTL9_9STRA|mmetsp:Transcript_26591/g.61216  ORF Transcript_26591/g.61216 Transcript_26591/m.61216 type:complete len:387 (+) Transcript_26591:230-1390(+)